MTVTSHWSSIRRRSGYLQNFCLGQGCTRYFQIQNQPFPHLLVQPWAMTRTGGDQRGSWIIGYPSPTLAASDQRWQCFTFWGVRHHKATLLSHSSASSCRLSRTCFLMNYHSIAGSLRLVESDLRRRPWSSSFKPHPDSHHRIQNRFSRLFCPFDWLVAFKRIVIYSTWSARPIWTV